MDKQEILRIIKIIWDSHFKFSSLILNKPRWLFYLLEVFYGLFGVIMPKHLSVYHIKKQDR